MHGIVRTSDLRRARAALGPALLVMATLVARPVVAQQWDGYARNPQHTALAAGPSQIPSAIRWQTPVDLQPQYSGDDLYIHYGSPAITADNTVLVPQKTGAQGGFVVNAFNGATGQQIWTLATDYVLPSHNWTPPMGIVLTPGDESLVIPAAGGTVLVRTMPNAAGGAASRVAFYGNAMYAQDPAEFNSAIQISTPMTADSFGNLYFGYLSSGAPLPGYPNGIPSGLARISASGFGSFISAKALCGDANIEKVAYNCTPAVTADGTKIYVAVNQSNYSYGYLCLVLSHGMIAKNAVLLQDPRAGFGNASVPDDGTASPTIGPDGDVYYGVLEANFPSNHARGWMLHFNSTLTTTKIPGAFGWDDSASIVPKALVPTYTGTSAYLILTKYNNYADPGIGGNGENKVAILDPNNSMQDPISNATVMNEVITILGPTANQQLGGVDEWCINSAAIDTANKCAVVNSEDGHVYRWNFTTNTLSTGLQLAPPTGEAYTSTLIGPDGAVYAINNAVLFCCYTPATTPPANVLPPGNIRPPIKFRPGINNQPPAFSQPPVIFRGAIPWLSPPRFFTRTVQGAGLIGILAALSLHFGIRAFRRSRTAAGSFLSA